MDKFFSLFASGLMLVVFVVYLRQVIKGLSTPNPAAWLIASVAATLNAITYILTVDGDWIKGSVSIMITLGIVAIFTYSWLNGKFAKITWVDRAILIVCGIVGIFWAIVGDPKISNLLMQIAMCLSFVPVIIGLLRHELREHPTAWTISCVSYLFMILGIIWVWDGNWYALAFPVFDGLGGNGVIAVIAFIQLKQNKTFSGVT